MASPPVAQLRQLISDCFDQEELRTLCVDLDIEYDSLAGNGKLARVRSLIEYMARRNRLIALIDYCAEQRKQYDWAVHRLAAQRDLGQFVPDALAPEGDTGIPASAATASAATAGAGVAASATAGGNIVLNANRALKLGFAAGTLVVSLFGCGLVSGLLASRVISLNPVQPSQQALQDSNTKIKILRSRPPASAIAPAPDNANGAAADPAVITPASALGTTKFASDELTSMADALIKRFGDQSKMREVHVRVEQDMVVVTYRQLGSNRQMAVAYTVQAQRGRAVLVAQSAWVHLLEIRSSTIGWLPIPVSWASETTTWIQQLINFSTKDFYFSRIDMRPDELTIAGVRIPT